MRSTIRDIAFVFGALTFLTGSSLAGDQVASSPPDLTPSQIARFLNSYPAVQGMAQEHWGERRFTPARKMLDPEGTFERAFTEMRYAGKLPDLDQLLQAHGFDNRKTWLRLAYRLSDAYVAFRTHEMGPEVWGRLRHALDIRYQALADQRKAVDTLTMMDPRRKEMLRGIEATQRRLDSEKRAMEEALLLQSFASQISVIDEFLPHKKVGKFATSTN